MVGGAKSDGGPWGIFTLKLIQMNARYVLEVGGVE
jgi:hypothetical protein